MAGRMKIVLTKKLAEQMDGVDVSACEVGDVLNVSLRDARLFVAEAWAIPDRRCDGHAPPPDDDRRRPSRTHELRDPFSDRSS
jgi:hypothetical protein